MAFTTEELENLSALMLASDDNNTRLAFEILDAQPETEFPKELITEIFVVYKMSKHKDYQDKAKTILDKYGSPALHKAMKRKLELGDVGQYVLESTIEKNINQFVAETELVGLKFARALYNKYHHGILYLLNHLPKEACLQFLENFVNGTSFTLTDKELNNLPPAFFELKELTEIDLTENRLGKFFKDFVAFPKLRVLVMKSNLLTTIPKNIGEFKSLEVLDISHNRLNKFPKDIGKLTQLRELNLSEISYGSLINQQPMPAELYQLKNLRKLTLGCALYENYPVYSTIQSDSEDEALDINPLPAARRAWQQQEEAVNYLFEHGDSAVIHDIIRHFYNASTKTLNLNRVKHHISFLPKELADWDIRHLNMQDMNVGFSHSDWSKGRALTTILADLNYLPKLESLDISGNFFPDANIPELLQLQHLQVFRFTIPKFRQKDMLAELQGLLPNCTLEDIQKYY